MRYATWSVNFASDSLQGTTPESIIRERGGEASGALNLNDFTFVGYFSDNSDISELELWNFQEITSTEALSYFPKNATIVENGIIFVPIAALSK